MNFTAVSLDEVASYINSKNDGKLASSVQSIATFSVAELVDIWNLSCSNMNLANTEKYSDSLLRVQEQLLLSLEAKYRRPWDERIYFQILDMYYNHTEFQMERSAAERVITKSLENADLLFEKMTGDCFCLSKENEKRALQLRSNHLCQKLRLACVIKQRDYASVLTDILNLIMKMKNSKMNGDHLFDNFIGIIEKLCTQSGCLERLMAVIKDMFELLPESEFVKRFRMDLLNAATEICLDLACKTRKNVDMDKWILEADGYNSKSLLIGVSVLGIFGHLKIVRVKEPTEFQSFLKENINRLKTQILSNSDIEKKIRLIKFLSTELSLQQALNIAFDVFSAANLSKYGSQILSHLLEIIYSCPLVEDAEKKSCFEMTVNNFKSFLAEDTYSMELAQLQLLNLAEKLSSCLLAVDILNICYSISGSLSDRILGKLIKCELKLGLLKEADEHLKQMSENANNFSLLMFEYHLRCNDQSQISQFISKLASDPTVNGYQLLDLYKLCGSNFKVAIQLLYQVLERLSKEDQQRVQVHKAIISILYNQILEDGMSDFRKDMDHNFYACFQEDQIALDDNEWLYKVSWNIGVIHSKAEAFEDACFGFNWALQFARRTNNPSSKLYCIFFLLSCRSCAIDGFETGDIDLVREARNILELDVVNDGSCYSEFIVILEVEICIAFERWNDLETVIKCMPESVEFEHLAEIILKSGNTNIPISVHKMALERLAHDSFASAKFDINRFSIIYRGLSNAALLEDRSSAVVYFREAVSIVKQSFGKYPTDEIVWLCAAAHNTALDLYK